MASSKKVLVSSAFMCNVLLLTYSAEEYGLTRVDPTAEKAVKALNKELQEKVEASQRRKAFSEYKNAEGEEREAARINYLDTAWIHKDWRSTKEVRDEGI